MPKMNEKTKPIDFESEDEIGLTLLSRSSKNKKSFKGYYMKIEGETDTGKTYMYLSLLKKAMSIGYSPENIMMCIVDCDLEGQEDIIETMIVNEVLDTKVLPSIHRHIIQSVSEVYQWTEYYSKLLTSFISEDSDNRVGFIVLENEYKFYIRTQEEYSLNVYKMPIRDLIMQQQIKARERTERNRDKANKIIDPKKRDYLMKQVFVPIFEEGQRDSFKQINRNYNNLFEYMKSMARLGGYNMVITTLRKEKVIDWGKKTQHTEITTLGRPDLIDYLCNLIFTLEFKDNGRGGRDRFCNVKKSRKSWITEGVKHQIDKNGFEVVLKGGKL